MRKPGEVLVSGRFLTLGGRQSLSGPTLLTEPLLCSLEEVLLTCASRYAGHCRARAPLPHPPLGNSQRREFDPVQRDSRRYL
jgi:hypothetical protein